MILSKLHSAALVLTLGDAYWFRAGKVILSPSRTQPVRFCSQIALTYGAAVTPSLHPVEGIRERAGAERSVSEECDATVG